MQTKGLRIAEGNLEKDSKLIQVIQELPDGTIEGLSEYESSSVWLDGEKIMIRRPSMADPLTIHFPEGSKNNISGEGISSFEYKGRNYEIHQ